MIRRLAALRPPERGPRALPADPLTRFGDRLSGGLLPTIVGLRPDHSRSNDTVVQSSPEFGTKLRGLALPPDSPKRRLDKAVDSFTAYLSQRPEALRFILYRPHELLDYLPELLCLDSEKNALGIWRVMALAVEASWSHFRTSDMSEDERRRLLPVSARTRFLVLSEPFRNYVSGDPRWVPSGPEEEEKLPNYLTGFLGADSWVVLVRRVNEARQEWQHHLDTYQSHPLLAHATGRALEAEVRALACLDRYCDGPLVLSEKLLKGAASPEPADLSILTDSVEEHLLPRFALLSAAGAALHKGQGYGPVLVTAATVLSWVAALTMAGLGIYGSAWIPAALTYALIGAGTLCYGRLWAMPWLLRVPAAAAVGLIVLISLHPHWWTGIRLSWPVPVVLIGAAFGYLLIEARNHGVGPVGRLSKEPRTAGEDTRLLDRAGRWAWLVAPGRALIITVIGLAHSFLTAVIGMTVLAPAFTETGTVLAQVWVTDGPTAEAGTILLMSTAWCLATGVFSQILWDDRPITAPLAHLRWRNER